MSPRKIRARLSHREDVFDDDAVELMLDTFHDHRRAYAFFPTPWGFKPTPSGPKVRASIFLSTRFSTRRRSLRREGFVVKLTIPFRSLRFASNDPQTWGILLNRDIQAQQ